MLDKCISRDYELPMVNLVPVTILQKKPILAWLGLYKKQNKHSKIVLILQHAYVIITCDM
jgi:hypothetical protein